MNPFILTSYKNPEFFCDREEETANLISAIDNSRNITLISQRRMGKTGLIKHIKFLRTRKNEIFIYLDILKTENFSDFVKLFGRTTYESIRSIKEKASGRFLQLVKSLRPVLTIDPVNQMPTLSFNTQQQEEYGMGFEEICSFLHSFDGKIIIAIDEFQQITNYPEKNVESILRTQFQHLTNTSFIYSGSQKHLMISIFANQRSAFYQSGDFLELGYIPKDAYRDFIARKFLENHKEISLEFITKGIDWCLGHTFYVQYFFNHLFGNTRKKISEADVKETGKQIIDEHAVVYDNYRNLLSKGQFNLLKAIAAETHIIKPLSGAFIQEYRLGSSSSVSQAFKALKNKDLIFEEKEGYRVSDVFFMHWMSL